MMDFNPENFLLSQTYKEQAQNQSFKKAINLLVGLPQLWTAGVPDGSEFWGCSGGRLPLLLHVQPSLPVTVQPRVLTALLDFGLFV